MKVKIGEVSELLRGVSYKKNDAKESSSGADDILVLRGGNIQDGKIFRKPTDEVFVDKSLVNHKQFLKKGDVVIVGSTGSSNLIGKAAIVDEDYDSISFGAFLMLIRPREDINAKYFDYYFLSSEYRNAIRELSSGVNINNIRKEYIENLEIPLPPLPEQERIVAKLDTLFAHLEQTKKRLEQIPVLLKQFRQAVLTQAVTGKLTEEWRTGKELGEVILEIKTTSFRKFNQKTPSKWKVIAFGDFAQIKSNLANPNQYWSLPMIAPDNIEKETGKLINIPLVSEIQPKSGKHHYNERVILYSKIRPYLSKLTIADFEGLCSADMYPITCKMNLNYLYYYMLSQEFLRFATSAGERSVLPKINQKSLEIIPVPVPPKEEQTEIVRRVESLFAKADAIEARYKVLKELVDKLPQAILGKAFRGEV